MHISWKQTVWSFARAVYPMSFTYLSVVIRFLLTFCAEMYIYYLICAQYLYGWLKTLFWCHFYSSSLKFYLSRSKSSEPLKNKFLPVIKVLISFNIRLSQVKSNMNFNINVLSFIYALSTSVWKKKQQQFSVVTGLETLFFFMHNCVRLASLIS